MNNDIFTDYETCHSDIKKQIDDIINGLAPLLQSNFTGAYLGGSMALGSFDVKTSDIDLTVIINNGLTLSDKIKITSFLLSVNKKPCPLEITFILREALFSSQNPLTYMFFCDYWIKTHEKIVLGGEKAQELFDSIYSDSDNITELKLIKQSGIYLYGIPVNELFPDVRNDLFWDLLYTQATESYVESENEFQSAFKVLQLCRIFAYKKAGEMLSKPKAAEWVLDVLPSSYHPIILSAFNMHYGMSDKISYTADDALTLKKYVIENIL